LHVFGEGFSDWPKRVDIRLNDWPKRVEELLQTSAHPFGGLLQLLALPPVWVELLAVLFDLLGGFAHVELR